MATRKPALPQRLYVYLDDQGVPIAESSLFAAGDPDGSTRRVGVYDLVAIKTVRLIADVKDAET